MNINYIMKKRMRSTILIRKNINQWCVVIPHGDPQWSLYPGIQTILLAAFYLLPELLVFVTNRIWQKWWESP